MTDASKLLASLDAPFLKFDKNQLNEPIIWRGDDVLIPVQKTFDVRVPAMAGSTIKYAFSTENGDIMVSTAFQLAGQSPELILSPMRVPSDVETINGSYKATQEGTFIITFDNNFSWFNPKDLTYTVSLYQVMMAVTISRIAM
jgi:hypothetical protein